MKRKALFLITVLTATAACSQAPESIDDTSAPLFVDNHVTGGHGPLSANGNQAAWGTVRLWSGSFGEDWLGSVDGNYIAHPTEYHTGDRPYVAMSPNFTFATAYEFEAAPGVFYGRSSAITTSFVQFAYLPAAIVISYDDACPLVNATQWTTPHPCTGDWTPFDGGGVPTFVIGNGIVKPGLPYGDYLKYTAPGGPGSWCTFNFSDLPNVAKPAGAPNHAVAIDSCP
ncbi:MAG TPA: hypothetical protein VNN25_05060 [Thermoanaerobaculia bacterium]|nr:hypothetical protein [Thermoanaerobaculia bacterium]